MCRYHIPTQLCIHTHIYSHTGVCAHPPSHTLGCNDLVHFRPLGTHRYLQERAHTQTNTDTELSASLQRTAPAPRSPPLWVFLPTLTVGLSCAMTGPCRAAVPHRAWPLYTFTCAGSRDRACRRAHAGALRNLRQTRASAPAQSVPAPPDRLRPLPLDFGSGGAEGPQVA